MLGTDVTKLIQMPNHSTQPLKPWLNTSH
jgi:hypothetical protein